MNTTSIGSVTLGLVLLFGGVAAVVFGAAMADAYGIAQAEGESQSQSFLIWESSSSSGSAEVQPMGVLGLVLAAGGILSALAGVIVTALSLDRGKDREVELEKGGD